MAQNITNDNNFDAEKVEHNKCLAMLMKLFN